MRNGDVPPPTSTADPNDFNAAADAMPLITQEAEAELRYKGNRKVRSACDLLCRGPRPANQGGAGRLVCLRHHFFFRDFCRPPDFLAQSVTSTLPTLSLNA